MTEPKSDLGPFFCHLMQEFHKSRQIACQSVWTVNVHEKILTCDFSLDFLNFFLQMIPLRIRVYALMLILIANTVFTKGWPF